MILEILLGSLLINTLAKEQEPEHEDCEEIDITITLMGDDEGLEPDAQDRKD